MRREFVLRRVRSEISSKREKGGEEGEKAYLLILRVYSEERWEGTGRRVEFWREKRIIQKNRES